MFSLKNLARKGLTLGKAQKATYFAGGAVPSMLVSPMFPHVV